MGSETLTIIKAAVESQTAQHRRHCIGSPSTMPAMPAAHPHVGRGFHASDTVTEQHQSCRLPRDPGPVDIASQAGDLPSPSYH